METWMEAFFLTIQPDPIVWLIPVLSFFEPLCQNNLINAWIYHPNIR